MMCWVLMFTINNHKHLLGTLATSKQGTEDVTNTAFQVGATDCTVHFIVIFCPLSARKLRRFHSFSQFLPGFGLSYKVIKFLSSSNKVSTAITFSNNNNNNNNEDAHSTPCLSPQIHPNSSLSRAKFCTSTTIHQHKDR